MGETINEWIERLLELANLEGFAILSLTVPLAIVQGVLGVFPFMTLILLHTSALGAWYGMIASWLTGSIAAIVVLFGLRYSFSEWLSRKAKRRMGRYEKWQHYFDRYGVWTIIVLRTVPIMPNNVISFMSSLALIKPSTIVVSSLVGNLSHIWLMGIISSTLLLPDTDIRLLTIGYSAFCLLLVAIFGLQQFRVRRRSRQRPSGADSDTSSAG